MLKAQNSHMTLDEINAKIAILGSLSAIGNYVIQSFNIPTSTCNFESCTCLFNNLLSQALISFEETPSSGSALHVQSVNIFLISCYVTIKIAEESPRDFNITVARQRDRGARVTIFSRSESRRYVFLSLTSESHEDKRHDDFFALRLFLGPSITGYTHRTIIRGLIGALCKLSRT